MEVSSHIIFIFWRRVYTLSLPGPSHLLLQLLVLYSRPLVKLLLRHLMPPHAMGLDLALLAGLVVAVEALERLEAGVDDLQVLAEGVLAGEGAAADAAAQPVQHVLEVLDLKEEEGLGSVWRGSIRISKRPFLWTIE